MIKKNTKIIFEGEKGDSKELIGGIPLSVGEIVKVTEEDSDQAKDFEVTDKKTEFFLNGEDQIANITYILKQK
ncbi:MAG: hypothetical protein PVJ67_03420 [Candidatus Pacearchaeota archaeon]|jgi:hypothetical protein